MSFVAIAQDSWLNCLYVIKISDWMRFRVEYVSLQDIHLGVRVLQEVEIFDRLGQEERFHSIFRLLVCVPHILERSICYLRFAVTLNALENFPSPLSVDGITGYLVQNKEGLNGFWSEDVIGCAWWHLEIIAFEVYVLWRYSRFLSCIHLIASIRDGFRGGHVPLGSRRVKALWISDSTKSQEATHEAYEVIHLSVEPATIQIWDLAVRAKRREER